MVFEGFILYLKHCGSHLVPPSGFPALPQNCSILAALRRTVVDAFLRKRTPQCVSAPFLLPSSLVRPLSSSLHAVSHFWPTVLAHSKPSSLRLGEYLFIIFYLRATQNCFLSSFIKYALLHKQNMRVLGKCKVLLFFPLRDQLDDREPRNSFWKFLDCNLNRSAQRGPCCCVSCTESWTVNYSYYGLVQ